MVSSFSTLLVIVLFFESSAVVSWSPWFDTPEQSFNTPRRSYRREIDLSIGDESLEKRDGYNCTSPGSNFNAACWAELNLSDYLLNPVTGWNHTTPICGPTQDGSTCCNSDETWTKCYLRLAFGHDGYDCSQINPQKCSYQSSLSPNLNASILPQVNYIVENIFTVNNFFTVYYEALSYSVTSAQTAIQSLINELDPVQPPKFNPLNLLTALSAGLAFLGAPSVAVSILALSTTFRTVSQTMIISLQQAPGTAKALWPTGTQNSVDIQVGALESQLGNTSSQLADMINNAVQLLMSDVPNFVKWAEGGQYCNGTDISLPQKTNGLDFALRTYMTSIAMQQNHWEATAILGPYETELDVTIDVGGSGGFGCTMSNNSICSMSDVPNVAWWWSQSTGHVYQLVQTQAVSNGPTAVQLLNDIIANDWAILEVLFDGSFNCTQSGFYGENIVNFNWDGTLDISCMSQLPIRGIPCGIPTKCPVNLVQGACPFEASRNNCMSASEQTTQQKRSLPLFA